MFKKFGGSKFGGQRGGGKPSRFGRDEEREMFAAVCGECGSDCQVPFRPSGNRPVLCRNCFKKNDAGMGFGDGERSFERRPEKRPYVSRPHDPANDRLKFIEMKLDRIIALLEEMGE